MAFYIEVFNKNNKNDVIGYVSFNARTGETFIVNDLDHAVVFDDLTRFKRLFDLNDTIYGDYFLRCHWDGIGEDPNKYYNQMSKKSIKKREKKLIKEVKKTARKRLDNLLRYIHWDVCNTVRCKRNIFVVRIYKDGKITSTSAFTVYDAAIKGVTNWLKEGIMTPEEAINYLSKYRPDMEKGFTVSKALKRSKANQKSLGIIC